MFSLCHLPTDLSEVESEVETTVRDTFLPLPHFLVGRLLPCTQPKHCTHGLYPCTRALVNMSGKFCLFPDFIAIRQMHVISVETVTLVVA